MMKTEIDFHEHFYYDSGELFWKTSRNGHCVGEKAGSDCGHGYWKIGVGYKKFYRHRVVWEMFNGPIPEGLVINHINGVRGDDRIENLELVTTVVNNSCVKRKNLNINNTSGVAGVYYCNTRHKWKASVEHLNHRYCLGSFDTFEEAVEARELAERDIFLGKNIQIGIRARSDSLSGERYIRFAKERNRWRVKIPGKKYKQFENLADAIAYRDAMLVDDSQEG